MKRIWLFAAAAALAFAGAAQAESPLTAAIEKGDHAAAMTLVTPASAKVVEDDGSTPLMWSAHAGDAELTAALIKAGADLKVTNAYGSSPMREAATAGSTATLKALLDAGADADSPTAEGQTSLMVVARTANVQAAQLLIDHGAKVNAVETNEGQTALMLAADQRQGSMVRLLIKAGAEVNRHSREHDNDIRVSAEPRVRYQPSGGLTALMLAARQDCLDCAKAMVAAGAKLNDVDPDGVTPLLTAVLSAHFDLARYLIDSGADVNRWDFWGRAPLWATVDYNTLPRGGRADRPSVDETSSLEMIRVLLAKGANPNAQLKGLAPLREVGPDRGADLIMGLGMTPLMIASGLGTQIQDTRGKVVTQDQAIKTIKRLIEAKADVNARDDRGNTAVIGAVFRGWNDVLKVLIDNGANPYLANNDGKTALDAARGKIAGSGRQAVSVDPGAAAIIEAVKPVKTASR